MSPDEKFIESILAIKDPVEMLRKIVDNQDYLGYDPYYSDFRAALLGTAEKILKERTPDVLGPGS